MDAKLLSRKNRRILGFKRLAVSPSGCSARTTKAINQEFLKLQGGSTVYKSIGPVLLKQDPIEARLAVDARLEFIGNEMLVV